MWGFIVAEQPAEKRVEAKSKVTEVKTEVKKEIVSSLDINKLAYAVAMAETHNCTKGYWKMYNNCFWIKNWNTAPCKKIGQNRMCIYETPQESYEAFKIIWQRWYVTFPNRQLASKWTWADRVDSWLKHVNHYYYNSLQ